MNSFHCFQCPTGVLTTSHPLPVGTMEIINAPVFMNRGPESFALIDADIVQVVCYQLVL